MEHFHETSSNKYSKSTLFPYSIIRFCVVIYEAMMKLKIYGQDKIWIYVVYISIKTVYTHPTP